MTYLRKKKFKNCDRSPEIETVSTKKFWVVTDNKGRLFYHRDGHIMVFSRRRPAQQWLEQQSLTNNFKIEKLSISITR